MTDQPTQPDTQESILEEMARVVETACRCSSILDSKRDDMKKLLTRYHAITSQATIDSSTAELAHHNADELLAAMHVYEAIKPLGLTVEQVVEAVGIYNDLPILGDGVKWNPKKVYFTPNPIWCDGDEYGTANIPFQDQFTEGPLQYIDPMTYCDEQENIGLWSQVFYSEEAARQAAEGGEV